MKPNKNLISKRSSHNDLHVKTKYKHPWATSVRRLLPVINVLHNKPSGQYVEQFSSLVSKMISHRGEKDTIKRLKSFRLSLQQYCLRQPVTEIPFCKTDKDGFPSRIHYLKPTLEDKLSVMYSLSFIRIIEEFKMTPQYEVSSITDPSSSDKQVIGEITEYIRSKPKILKVLPTELMYADLIMSNKAGPNGPASISCLSDLAGLTQKAPELLETIKRRIEKYAGMLNFDGYEIPNGEFKHSKLVLLSDKACKTRVIAIADWWTNVCLSPLHNAFMTGLQRLPTDVTYYQDKISDLIKEMGKSLYSSDMTAFTDRFPIELECEVIKAKYGEQECSDWKQLISDREFFHKNGSVTYKVGNPMGLLSSWAVSTFTHHVVKHWCAHKLGIKDYKYLILGDDTLDTNEDVYRLYTSTIESLGVSISHDKCTQSKDGYAEFAKRLFSPEGEVTGLPVHLLRIKE
jgi:hypothetical protein